MGSLKIFIFLIFLFLIPRSLNSQTFKVSGNVVDSETKQGLPYTNIMVLNYSIGTTSDIHGNFVLHLNDSLKNEILVFSYVGYNSYKIGIDMIRSDTVLLKPLQYEISEVVVKPAKRKEKALIVNKFHEKDSHLRYSISPFNNKGILHIPYCPNEPTIEALYFPYNSDFENQNRLKEVWLYLSNFKISKSHFRLRIFDAKEDKSPGNDLLTRHLNIEVSGNNVLVKVNVEEYNIFIQKQGVFIGFELLILPENSHEISNEVGEIATVYSPLLRQLYSKNIGDYWMYSKGEWIMSKYWYFTKGVLWMSDNKDIKVRNTSNAMLFRPAISIILTN
jgi:hypothetical protein